MDVNGRALFGGIAFGRLDIGRIVASCRRLFVGAFCRSSSLDGTVFSEVGAVFSKSASSLAESASSDELHLFVNGQ